MATHNAGESHVYGHTFSIPSAFILVYSISYKFSLFLIYWAIILNVLFYAWAYTAFITACTFMHSMRKVDHYFHCVSERKMSEG